MTPEQLKRRTGLLARNDAALDRSPQRSGQQFVEEMSAIREGLEALAREMDAAQDDRLERSRNWRFVGNAYFDMADAKDLSLLRLGADAYHTADALLEGIDDPVERMKLDYSYGHTLYHLSDATDLSLLQEARRRYASALKNAKTHVPAGVEHVREALANADRAIAMCNQIEGLSQRMRVLERKVEDDEAKDMEPRKMSQLDSIRQTSDRLRPILGHLAAVERRLQSQVSVPLEELRLVAQEVDELQALAQQMGPASGPWDVFYRKYNSLLHPYLQEAGLRPDVSTPAAWDASEAMQNMVNRAMESERKLQTVTFVSDLYKVVAHLESGQHVSDQVLQPLLDQIDEQADAVVGLAPEHPQLPAQFAEVRNRLRVQLDRQGRKGMR